MSVRKNSICSANNAEFQGFTKPLNAKSKSVNNADLSLFARLKQSPKKQGAKRA